VYSAGSSLARRVFDQFEQTWGVKIGQIYGATEFGAVTFNDPDTSSFDPEAAGHPMDGVVIRILDTRDPCLDRPLPPEADGLVAVAAPSMLSGYVDDSRPATEGGFLLTGDLGRLDTSGTLRLSGRSTLLVDVGGIKVNPIEVESVLMRHPDVREAVVFAIPSSNTTARLKAIVVPEPGREVSGEELRRFARQHLIHYKIPRVFEIRMTMPRTATGKILRKERKRAMDASS
jgi:long-chain acyl-CoA synthetase